MRITLVLFSLCLALFGLPCVSFAQANASGETGPLATPSKAASQSLFDLNSSWFVTMVASGRTFSLHLAGGTKDDSAGKILLNAVLDVPGRPPFPANAEVVETAQSRTLTFVTGLGGRVAALQNPDGASFTGTVTNPTGQVFDVNIRKFTDQERVDHQRRQESLYAIKEASTNVPAACAVFIGRWKGAWPNNMTGRDGDPRWLWVTEVDEKCVAKIAYQYSPDAPRTLQSAEIKDGQLVAACTKGTCTFKNRGGDLWVDYNGSDGYNTTVFRKVN